MITPEILNRYVADGAILRDAVTGLDCDELIARPGPGDWSIQEVIIHLTDSDAIAIDRMKRIITEENPPLLYANESAYVENLFCDEQSIEDALLLFEVNRRQFARTLRHLPQESFDRIGNHNRRGQVTLGGLILDYIDHVQDHLKFIQQKKAKLLANRQK